MKDDLIPLGGGNKEKYQQMGRLSVRVEGNMWNAYYALPESDERIYLGGIQGRFVEDTGRRQLFLYLMKDAVGDLLQDIIGQRPIWPD